MAFKFSDQLRRDLDDFQNSKVILSKYQGAGTLRFGIGATGGMYTYNQGEVISLIDLYYNSVFEDRQKDNLGQTKMFLNVGKFRTEVAAKQIDIDVKDFRFVPDDYASPWVSFFFQKEFVEFAKLSDFGELLNTLVDTFPKYGTVVLKNVRGKPVFVPLQLLRNEQTADTLEKASYVIEVHPAMTSWEIRAMPGWKTEGLDLGLGKTYEVLERYGYVPRGWLKENGTALTDTEGDAEEPVDALVISTTVSKSLDQTHIFYASEIKKRPYLEAHWNKQHGRWLGLGVMEDLFENQRAKNIVVNMQRRAMHWSSQRVFQTKDTDLITKNLVKDVEDGGVIKVGQMGDISRIDLTNKSNVDFDQFVNMWEENASQKTFTYEVATGEKLPSGTPFRLAVVLTDAVNSYFALKREKLGLFLRKVVKDFLVPEFKKNMKNKDRVFTLFAEEPGYEALKDAAMDWVRTEAARASLLGGQPVDVDTLESAITPYDALRQLSVTIEKGWYEDVEFKVDLTVTGEEVNLEAKITTLTNLYQALTQAGDPRAEKVLERAAALAGENMAVFGIPKPRPVAVAQPEPTGSPTLGPQPPPA